MYGDSVSAGYGMTTQDSWGYLLQETFKVENPNIEFINESISGETSGGGLARLPNVIKRHRLSTQDWIIIELGGNDGLRGFPVKTLKQNLTGMIKMAKEAGVKVALMEVKIPPNYGKRYTSMLEEQYSTIAEQFKLPLLPFFMESIAVNPEYMLSDGIHPNISAQVLIRDIMRGHVETLVNAE
jgi:acyl-CoA thioesterase-1